MSSEFSHRLSEGSNAGNRMSMISGTNNRGESHHVGRGHERMGHVSGDAVRSSNKQSNSWLNSPSVALLGPLGAVGVLGALAAIYYKLKPGKARADFIKEKAPELSVSPSVLQKQMEQQYVDNVPMEKMIEIRKAMDPVYGDARKKVIRQHAEELGLDPTTLEQNLYGADVFGARYDPRYGTQSRMPLASEVVKEPFSPMVEKKGGKVRPPQKHKDGDLTEAQTGLIAAGIPAALALGWGGLKIAQKISAMREASKTRNISLKNMQNRINGIESSMASLPQTEASIQNLGLKPPPESVYSERPNALTVEEMSMRPKDFIKHLDTKGLSPYDRAMQESAFQDLHNLDAMQYAKKLQNTDSIMQNNRRLIEKGLLMPVEPLIVEPLVKPISPWVQAMRNVQAMKVAPPPVMTESIVP